jgi:uncharacterized membrane protein
MGASTTGMTSETASTFAALPRVIMRWLLAAFFVAAGIAHLVAPDVLLTITPDGVPFAPQVILVAGLCELAGASALLTRPLRKGAGVALALYALSVWPANIKQAFDHVVIAHIPDT